MRKIAVNGVNGRLGSTLMKLYPGCYPLHADITKVAEVQEELKRVNPDVLIHCAAYTDVDGCETNHDKAYQVNMVGVRNIRQNFDGRMILLSTDYVFNGKKGNYTEKDNTDPINFYGLCKYGAEGLIYLYDHPDDTIVRTNVLYGSHNKPNGLESKPDFVRRIVEQFSGVENIPVTHRLSGSPTHVEHLSTALMDLATRLLPMPKIINIAGTNILTRYEFALMIADVFGFDRQRLIPVTTPHKAIAPRPPKCGLNVSLALEYQLPLWSAHEGVELMRSQWK
jgi:dTDP-4-dehydrorhamnose reductase